MRVYSTDPNGKRIEITNEPQEIGFTVPQRYAYAKAWKDLRTKFIDQLTVKPEGYLYADDLKKAMDEMLVDYKIY